MANLTVVVGGQFGSEGKGAITAHLARQFDENDLNIRVGGPNAGHTVWDSGTEWKLRQVPAGAPVSRCRLAIAAGSEIDQEVLFSELAALDAAGHEASARISIHPSASIITPDYANSEKGLVGRIGSTGKGIGATRAGRIMREAMVARDLYDEWSSTWKGRGLDCQPDLGGSGCDPQWIWDANGRVIVEGTQGYGLGLHTQYYPHVTSSDCTAVDFLSMAGISPWHELADIEVIVVARVYPIRVAGNSGPLEGETTWRELGLEAERTTVTNKVRRVGTWNPSLVKLAVRRNGGGAGNPRVTLALTMLDQMFPEVKGIDHISDLRQHKAALTFLRDVEAQTDCTIGYIGTSPTTVVETGGWL